MKKIILSSVLIVAFVLYIFSDRLGIFHSSSVTNPVVPPDKTQNKNIAAYKDGEYTGDITDAYYGNVQVKAVIKDGKISDVQFLDYPKDRGTSLRLSLNAMPILKTEAIAAQNANVNIVSGATQTSEAFNRSLSSALLKARI